LLFVFIEMLFILNNLPDLSVILYAIYIASKITDFNCLLCVLFAFYVLLFAFLCSYLLFMDIICFSMLLFAFLCSYLLFMNIIYFYMLLFAIYMLLYAFYLLLFTFYMLLLAFYVLIFDLSVLVCWNKFYVCLYICHSRF
jgi:hypothetical protein